MQKLKLKAFSKILGQTALIALITFVMSEITLRIYNKIDPSFVFYDSSYNRFRGKPNAPDYDFKLNSQGFKDVEFTVEKPAGIYRILGIGDSFAYGVVPYEYNYLTLLEEQLNQSGQKTEVINMGIPGMGPRDYLSILVNEGLKLNPDKVVVFFYIGNDFLDNVMTAKLRTEEKSYVIALIKSLIKIQSNYQGKVLNPTTVKYNDNQPTFNNEKYLQDTVNKSNMFVRNPADGIFKSFVEDAVQDLLKIKQICDSQNIPLTVVIIPDEVQVNSQLQQQVKNAFDPNDPNLLDFELPNRMLTEQLQQANIDYLDLLPSFKVASQQTRLYKPNDTHWNIAGNRLAAELISQHLNSKNNQP
ncbi:MAG: SGNH/GDSL hydrolase family protein [Planktothrix sp.]|uniref:SGNH/GDSL hydrolase family protein n=1 Tax=Planktothrix sp. TaxID=3088171 RepID=UPI0038D39445